VTQVWIATSGLAEDATMSPRNPIHQADSDGELEVDGSDEELLSLGRVVPKVQQLDQVQHTLNKGPWVVLQQHCL